MFLGDFRVAYGQNARACLHLFTRQPSSVELELVCLRRDVFSGIALVEAILAHELRWTCEVVVDGAGASVPFDKRQVLSPKFLADAADSWKGLVTLPVSTVRGLITDTPVVHLSEVPSSCFHRSGVWQWLGQAVRGRLSLEFSTAVVEAMDVNLI